MVAVIKSTVGVARELAERVKTLRLARGWSRAELAERAGLAFSTLRMFEQTGQISLERLLMIAKALGAIDGFDGVFTLPRARTLAEIEERTVKRVRGRRRRR